jgi:hypothetical protein
MHRDIIVKKEFISIAKVQNMMLIIDTGRVTLPSVAPSPSVPA